MKRFSLYEKKGAYRLHSRKQGSAETFQEVLRFTLQHASNGWFLIAKIRSAAQIRAIAYMLLKTAAHRFV
ncbi:hypothetical protein E2R62_08030 [Citrobacter rodentium]|uniref:Uncharacterized protein n=1 Tax=Citrobacter rodentium TaxID=67825 RepID=A0A482PL43_CITRO|nr:hypothetical protein E2R62_08030 [Citrobacter rodentium]HAT8015567.1 hypothetical protein [Citrobacter rodentium NBRC 105723 = DSM 16636]HAT8020396.1 hypothetical protein [Citrobacter rodentium]HAT8030303.1 hypothetical protein [Citrobacter rodentium]HAT8035116.1 hypothetical protein [Citrobacter rodentium]